jgi:hypothetical protein
MTVLLLGPLGNYRKENQMAKVRVQAMPPADAAAVRTLVDKPVPAVPVDIIDVKPGEVSFLDKLKGYYHTLSFVVGGLIVSADEFTPVFDFLPENWRHGIAVGTAVAVGLFNFLKSNEVWLDKADVQSANG